MTDIADPRETIAAIWAEVLGTPVEEDDDFYLLGGHSLLATRMIARVEQAFSVKVTLRQVLDNATLGEFCDLVEDLRSQSQPV